MPAVDSKRLFGLIAMILLSFVAITMQDRLQNFNFYAIASFIFILATFIEIFMISN